MTDSSRASTSGRTRFALLETARSPLRWAPREQHELPVRLSGRLPEWLHGTLVRTCPAVFERGAYAAEHLFDGLGLVYAFELGAVPKFRQHLLESRNLAEAEQGKNELASFDSAMQRGLWQRLTHPVPRVTDNANVNVIPWQGEWLAMTETPHQHRIDGLTLRTRGRYEYDDEFPRQLSMTAHPHYDPTREALVNVGTTFGPKNELWIYRQGRASHKREVEGRLALKRIPYVHSFGLTARHAVLIDQPWTVNPLRMLFSNKGYIAHFSWQPERGTRFWCFDRANKNFSRHETESLFCFHTVNTFEDKGAVVFDFLAYDDPSLVGLLRLESLERHGFPSLMPRFVRARLEPGARRVALEPLSNVRFDFPQIAYRKHAGQPYGHVWGTVLGSDSAKQWTSEIVHVEPGQDRVQRFSDPDLLLGEPVFVPEPGSSSEVDGVLLTVGSHRRDQKTELLVLHAASLEPVARCSVEAAIPLGFHGSFAFETG